MSQRTKTIKFKRIVLSELMCARLTEHLAPMQRETKDHDAILTIGTLLLLIDAAPIESITVNEPRIVDHEAR